MLEPTLITWILFTFGFIFIFLPMLYFQLLMILRPQSQKIRDIIIGRGEDWRDKTHFRMSYGIGWADLIIWSPLFAVGSIGVLLGQAWGYALWTASGAISVYINIILWFSEREYVYPKCGLLVYYAYFWVSLCTGDGCCSIFHAEACNVMMKILDMKILYNKVIIIALRWHRRL